MPPTFAQLAGSAAARAGYADFSPDADVVVWGGPARLAFHGIDALSADEHRLTGACRYNLTFRRAQ